ncbi:DsbA family oxidoreductase [Streptomyces kunmingensis]|uniref:DsbA family oxidoreductase n=1 Tax=Streptomyces kunmingensis TaxID=68225 RepID=A0ABU6C7S6_9ACTN|nr:DsbA family oxidoreductase [Streptomyces kunmingensis]MEB3960764.1 DsbA family oxidoreductase [Streptomyces kunmingensis]
MRVEIWTDINCPFCYIGKSRFEQALDAFPHKAEVEVVHRSFELDPSAAKGETGLVVPHIAQKYGISEAQAAANEQGLGRQAQALGLPYLTEGRDYGNSFDLHRLLHLAQDKGVQDAMIDALYRGNFAEQDSVFADEEHVVRLAVAAGLDEAEVRAVLADPDRYAEEVRADEREAAELGATGVPFFVLDRKFGVSGAQPAEVFTQALTQAWDSRSPLTVIDSADGGDACGPDGCAVPQA